VDIATNGPSRKNTSSSMWQPRAFHALTDKMLVRFQEAHFVRSIARAEGHPDY
jgi:hypothetical protein